MGRREGEGEEGKVEEEKRRMRRVGGGGGGRRGGEGGADGLRSDVSS